jgi:hypothetical protein
VCGEKGKSKSNGKAEGLKGRGGGGIKTENLTVSSTLQLTSSR